MQRHVRGVRRVDLDAGVYVGGEIRDLGEERKEREGLGVSWGCYPTPELLMFMNSHDCLDGYDFLRLLVANFFTGRETTFLMLRNGMVLQTYIVSDVAHFLQYPSGL